MHIVQPEKWNVGIQIVSLGVELGSKVIDNLQLQDLGYPATPEQIEKRTGIQQRHHVRTESSECLAVLACNESLKRGHYKPENIDQLVVASSSPDLIIPTLASRIHRKLQLNNAVAHNISASCSGFIFALDIACRSIMTGLHSTLVCATETRSKQLDITDKATGALFGDASGAALICSGPVSKGLLAFGITNRFSPQDTVTLQGGERAKLQMHNGAHVYFEAVEGMVELSQEFLDGIDSSWNDIDWVIPHQANARIIKRFCWRMNLPESKVFVHLSQVGNTSSASIPLALYQAIRQGVICSGHRVLLLTVGAGFTGGAALILVDEALIETVRD